ncbi:hypothetical protein FRUB_04845 [Fimbriiglobus ruber]|uniref:Uncharacterized protein n=1 Tax=Fimbriiglobus ruber TaxID=1908690 RepID=A0A225DIZ6_9BACT|nr:hypothetical protein FRUB_04845 [Fimbriiglobus ruber]
MVARELPDYVRRCADRYAESLFATAVIVSQAANHTDAETAPTNGS